MFYLNLFSAVSRNMAKMLLVAAAISAPATSVRVTAAPVSSAAVVDDSPVKMKDAPLGGITNHRSCRPHRSYLGPDNSMRCG